MPPISSLDELVAEIDDLAAALARNSTAVTRASIDRWFLGPDATISYIPSIRMEWKVSFVKAGSSSLFWFFKNTSDQRTLIDARIDVGMDSTPAPTGATSPAFEDLRWEYVFPPFIMLDVTDEELFKFGPVGATRENTIFLASGAEGRHVLAVLLAPKLKQCRVRYSLNGIPGPVEPMSGRYSLLPFLDLIGTMRSWLRQTPGSGKPIRRAAPEDGNPVRQIVRSLAEAYTRTWSSLASDPARVLPPPLHNIYEVSAFGSQLKLRLTADGELAEKEKDERFQLQLSQRIAQEAGHVVQLWLSPPDFLMSGALYDAFFDELLVPDVTATLSDEFDVNENEMKRFLATARSRSSIFRVDRSGDEDVDVLALLGSLEGKDALLMFGATFRVESDRPTPKVEFTGDEIDVIVSQDQDPNTLTVELDKVEYFLRLLMNMKRWSAIF